jgi:hypothetical protein
VIRIWGDSKIVVNAGYPGGFLIHRRDHEEADVGDIAVGPARQDGWPDRPITERRVAHVTRAVMNG